MKTQSFFMKMSDGEEVWVNRWIPDDDMPIKGVIHLHHGLAEHCMRYDRFGSVLVEKGYVLSSHDMRGHGHTAQKAEEKGTGCFGQLAKKDGFNRVVEDLHELIEKDRADYPGVKMFLFGHSFGSFVSQGYIEKYGENIVACILCGTSGPAVPKCKAGNVVANIVAFFRGRATVVPALPKICFGTYNNRIENPYSKNAWISTNIDNIKMYESDDWCDIGLTTSFFCDMTSGMAQIHSGKNMKKIPKNLPVFFIYGEEDPVGAYGVLIQKLIKIYKDNGMVDVTYKSYPGDKHEILNEADHETVERDVLEWIEKKQ